MLAYGLKHLSEKTGIMQLEVAKKLGVREATVSAWYNGHSFPSEENLKKLAEIFDVETKDLFSVCSKSEPDSYHSSMEKFLKQAQSDFSDMFGNCMKNGIQQGMEACRNIIWMSRNGMCPEEIADKLLLDEKSVKEFCSFLNAQQENVPVAIKRVETCRDFCQSYLERVSLDEIKECEQRKMSYADFNMLTMHNQVTSICLENTGVFQGELCYNFVIMLKNEKEPVTVYVPVSSGKFVFK